MMFLVRQTWSLLAATTFLAACAGSSSPDYTVSCIIRTGAPGAYDSPAGVAVPTVTPAEGGTQSGADAINACIRELAGVNTGPGVGASTPVSERASVQASGNTVVRQYEFGNAPLDGAAAAAATASTPTKSRKGQAGPLPLPTGYPLLAGDAELWPTLTREQQELALVYLQDGSTIRASLRTD